MQVFKRFNRSELTVTRGAQPLYFDDICTDGAKRFYAVTMTGSLYTFTEDNIILKKYVSNIKNITELRFIEDRSSYTTEPGYKSWSRVYYYDGVILTISSYHKLAYSINFSNSSSMGCKTYLEVQTYTITDTQGKVLNSIEKEYYSEYAPRSIVLPYIKPIIVLFPNLALNSSLFYPMVFYDADLNIIAEKEIPKGILTFMETESRTELGKKKLTSLLMKYLDSYEFTVKVDNTLWKITGPDSFPDGAYPVAKNKYKLEYMYEKQHSALSAYKIVSSTNMMIILLQVVLDHSVPQVERYLMIEDYRDLFFHKISFIACLLLE